MINDNRVLDGADIISFRENILANMQTFNSDFENYITAQLYLDDINDPSELNVDFLINKGMEFLERTLGFIGITNSVETYDSFYHINVFVNIHNFLHPTPFLRYFTKERKDLVSDIKHFLVNYEDNDFLCDFFNFLFTETSSLTFKEWTIFSQEFLSSNSSFMTYLKKVFNDIIKTSPEYLDKSYSINSVDIRNIEEETSKTVNAIKRWNNLLLLIYNRIVQIEETEEFPFKDDVIIYLKKWYNLFSSATWVDILITIFSEEHVSENPISQHVKLFKEEYLKFKKVTFGYPEYLKKDLNSDLYLSLEKYINELDPIPGLLSTFSSE